jgi:hypothetical protein
MKGPFSYSKQIDVEHDEYHFRIADVDDNAVAFCYDEDNAKEIVKLLDIGVTQRDRYVVDPK